MKAAHQKQTKPGAYRRETLTKGIAMKKLVKPNRGAGRAPNPVYEAIVYGELSVMKNGVNQPTSYEYGFKFTHAMLQERSALSIFKNEVAPIHFPHLFPGFQAVLTHYLREVRCPEDPTRVAENPTLLNRDGLLDFIDDYGLPVEPGLYPDDDQLRQAVIDCVDDEEVFLVHQRRRKEKYGPAAEVRAELMQLNPVPTLAQAAAMRVAAATAEAGQSLVTGTIDEVHTAQEPPVQDPVPPTPGVAGQDEEIPMAPAPKGKKGSKPEADEV